MSDGKLNIPINVVKDEIVRTLELIAQELESYYEEEKDSEKLSTCSELLHQIQGSLQVLNIGGLEQLADEMRELTLAIKNGSVLQESSAFELLLGATLFLPRYLEYMQSHQKDEPVLILPTINALRVARKAQILPEHAFVSFKLTQLPDLDQQDWQEAHDDLAMNARRLRHMYQVGLLGVIQGAAMGPHLKYMKRAIERLSDLCGVQPFCEIWRITDALIEAIDCKAIPTNTSVKFILGTIDREIRRVVDGGAGVLSGRMTEDLRDNLLYYLAKAESDNKKVKAIRDLYKLQDLVHSDNYLEEERNKLEAPDRSVIQRVAEEIASTLTFIKERLDLLDRTESLSNQVAEHINESLGQIAVTLKMLDLKHASQTASSAQMSFVAATKDGNQPDKVKIVEIADQLMSVEIAVIEFSHGLGNGQGNSLASHFNEAQYLAVKEARTNLDDIKTSLDAFMKELMDVNNLIELPGLLAEVRGALTILQLERAANILKDCENFITTNVLSGTTHPSDTDMETLADALASIEWYLEGYTEYHNTDDGLLDVAEESIVALGTH